MKAPKITLPFMDEEPEVVTMPVARDVVAERWVLECVLGVSFDMGMGMEAKLGPTYQLDTAPPPSAPNPRC